MTIADLTIIPCSCPFCGAITRIHTTTTAWNAYEDGALAQDAFPDLSATERETLISGLCAGCQYAVFGEEDEDA